MRWPTTHPGTRRSSTLASPSCTARHLRDVYSYSYYRVGNHHDAEDLTEQTFLQAYRHFERALRESNGRPLRPVAHPDRPQPGGELLPRPLAQAGVGDRGRRDDLRPAHHRVAGRGPRGAEVDPRRRPAAARRPPRGADHALRAGHGQPRDRPRARAATDGATKVLLHRAIRQLEGIVAERAATEPSASEHERRHAPTSRRCCARRWRRSSRRPTWPSGWS